MPGTLRLSAKEANDLADLIDERGGSSDSLRAVLRDIGNPHNSKSAVTATNIADEEWLEEKRAQSTIEEGTDLECVMCHEKFDHLISGTCESCFREWMLSVPRPPKMKKLL